MTPEKFRETIIMLLILIDNDNLVSDRIEIPVSVLSRWESGVACPLPRTRIVIVREMIQLLAEMWEKE